ncbi:TetR/AcrR family transcriptional regulator [Clostridium felsineum]|uniref:TetR/AcrR family transcriptional regulator n=1 Tax=Clostridium felsineum TaxID=36839 RepID=UPI00098C0AAC|nr:TetR/AcrR family transcriptional regulator [Clostridium felsineum]URZ18341.1 hypothetical protein CLFE_044110 [Clostridium felsineum DSM 794]
MQSISRKERERKAREQDILNAAEKVFNKKSYTDTSMEEIARECDFSRKTLYQYFKDKESLCYAVITRGLERLLTYLEMEEKNGSTGFQKLHNLSIGYYKFYKAYPSTLSLMNHVGSIKLNKENTTASESFVKSTNKIASKIANIIDEGKKDGSIRTDIDTMKLAVSSEFLITSFFNMLSISGKTFMNHFSLDEEAFISFTLTLLNDAIRKNN